MQKKSKTTPQIPEIQQSYQYQIKNYQKDTQKFISKPINTLSGLINVKDYKELQELLDKSGIILSIDKTPESSYILKYLGYYATDIKNNKVKIAMRDYLHPQGTQLGKEYSLEPYFKEFLKITTDEPFQRYITIIPIFNIVKFLLAGMLNINLTEKKSEKIQILPNSILFKKIEQQIENYKQFIDLNKFVNNKIEKIKNTIKKYAEEYGLDDEEKQELQKIMENNIKTLMQIFQYTKDMFSHYIELLTEYTLSQAAPKIMDTSYKFKYRMYRQTTLEDISNIKTIIKDLKQQIQELEQKTKTAKQTTISQAENIQELKETLSKITATDFVSFTNRVYNFFNTLKTDLNIYNGVIIPTYINLNSFLYLSQEILENVKEIINISITPTKDSNDKKIDNELAQKILNILKSVAPLYDYFIDNTNAFKEIISNYLTKFSNIVDSQKLDKIQKVLVNIQKQNLDFIEYLKNSYSKENILKDLEDIMNILFQENPSVLQKKWATFIGYNIQENGILSYLLFVKKINDKNNTKTTAYIIWFSMSNKYDAKLSIDYVPIDLKGIDRFMDVINKKGANFLEYKFSGMTYIEFEDLPSKVVSMIPKINIDTEPKQENNKLHILNYVSNMRKLLASYQNITKSTNIDQNKFKELQAILQDTAKAFNDYQKDLELLYDAYNYNIMNIPFTKLIVKELIEETLGDDRNYALWIPVSINLAVFREKLLEIIEKNEEFFSIREIIKNVRAKSNEKEYISTFEVLNTIIANNYGKAFIVFFPAIYRKEKEMIKKLKEIAQADVRSNSETIKQLILELLDMIKENIEEIKKSRQRYNIGVDISKVLANIDELYATVDNASKVKRIDDEIENIMIQVRKIWRQIMLLGIKESIKEMLS